MANFPQFHGITLANNSWVENLVVETLAEDPVASGAGRVWFNSTTKTWNASFLDDLGAVVTKKFNTLEDFDTFLTNLAATTSGKGANLVGYEGKTGANSLFSISASTLKSSLDSIVTELDANKKLVSEITGGTGGGASLVTIQSELDTTQTGAGLSATGTYVTPTTTNYLNSTTSLANADATLDTKAKSLQDELDTTQTGAGLSATGAYVVPTATNYLNSTTSLANANSVLDTTIKAVQDEVNTTQTGAGLSATGTYTANGTSNYITAATSLKDADDKLDAAVKSVRTDLNAQIYTLETSVAALTHTVTHNLNSAFVNYNVWIKDSEGVYHNDIVAVTETSANVLTVDLTVARNIKIAVRKVAAI